MHVDKPSAAAYVPGPQSIHDATVDAVEYLPAAHGVQLVAPAATPVSVIEPAAQVEQYDWPRVVWYLPGSHALQAPWFFVTEY